MQIGIILADQELANLRRLTGVDDASEAPGAWG